MAFDLSSFENRSARYLFRYASGKDRRRLWLKLAKMMGNGVQLMQAIDSLRIRRLEGHGKSDAMTIALTDWLESIDNGMRLATAVSGWVSKEEEMLIAAGEQSGSLVKALNSTARLMVAKSDIAGAVVSGLAYPIVLVIVAFAALYVIGFKAVPAFSNAIHNVEWTGMAAGMIALSNFAQHWLALFIAAILLLIVAFFISLPRLTGNIRVRLDRYAPYSIYRIMNGSSWLIATSALVSAGLRTESALEQLSEGASPWMVQRLSACLVGVRSGMNVGDALLESGLEFPDREIIDDLGIYAALSGLDEALEILGNEWMTESVERIKSQMNVVFGTAMLLVAGFVGFMASGLAQMQIQLATAMQQAVH